jgi:hypothetical protein
MRMFDVVAIFPLVQMGFSFVYVFLLFLSFRCCFKFHLNALFVTLLIIAGSSANTSSDR